MQEVLDTARLVDAGAVAGRGIAATVPRSEIEDVLRSEDGSPELVLDLVRGGAGDVEAHSLRLAWDPSELEELLRRSEGDEVTLLFDGVELEKVFDDMDVEAHGIRERAVVLAVAAAAVAGGTASHASAYPLIGAGGGGSSAAPIAMVSDSASSGPVTPIAMVSDAASSGPVAPAVAPDLVSDNALSGPQPVQAASVAQGPSSLEAIEATGTQSAQPVSDNALSGPQPVPAASLAQGPSSLEAIEGTGTQSGQLVSDNALSGPQPVRAASVQTASGDSSISAPSAETTGAIVGGALLAISAVFVTRRRRTGGPRPA